MKKIFRFLLVIVVVLCLAWFSVRLYLNSRQVAGRVVAQLQKVYGGHVKLDEVDIGLTTSALNRIEFSETDCSNDAQGKTPWLSIESFLADVSIFDLLKKEALPTQVKLKGVKLFLRLQQGRQALDLSARATVARSARKRQGPDSQHRAPFQQSNRSTAKSRFTRTAIRN